jgi:CubicO group peptidase (beta-lactamase class C family)
MKTITTRRPGITVLPTKPPLIGVPIFSPKYISALALTALLSLTFCTARVWAREQILTPAPTAHLTITLDSVPENTPTGASIYVAGSFNSWRPDDARYRMTPQAHGKYTLVLPDLRGPIQFKFTLGSWGSSERQAGGAELANRNVTIPADGVAAYRATVGAWGMVAQNPAQLRKALEKILLETHTPGMAVAIVRKGGIEWVAGLGMADVAAKRPANAYTLFRIASVSKNFAALAILQLVNAGKLSLHDPVRQHVPEVWFENRWEYTDPVRVVDLLEHTTGWDDVPLKAYGSFPPEMRLSDALSFARKSRVSRWKPGTRMAYCNSGAAVVALIVEKITGQRFEDYVQQNLFAPIGMKTATYFQAMPERASTLYYADGTSAVPYRHVLFRPAGGLNASANDMAAYLTFLLHRGLANGVPVLPVAALDRVETPTRAWGARQGLTSGYGLFNEILIDNGMVYRGHEGSTVGALSVLGYSADHAVGYFYSINAWNGEAFQKIGHVLRDYLARDAVKPALPAVAALPASAQAYVGWYEPASPRNANRHFLNRLLELTHLGMEDGQLTISVLTQKERIALVPVSGKLFRFAPDPVATIALVDPTGEGDFIVAGGRTWKRISRSLVMLEIGLVAWVALALLMTLLYTPFWLVAACAKRWRQPSEMALKALPLMATAGLIATELLPAWAGEQSLARLGTLTVYSAGVWLASVLAALASSGLLLALWIAYRRKVRRTLLAYAAFVAVGLLVACAYLGYWGVIGYRSWA